MSTNSKAGNRTTRGRRFGDSNRSRGDDGGRSRGGGSFTPRSRRGQPEEPSPEERYEASMERTLSRIKPVEARTERQADYIASIAENVVTFGIGPAGTGKSYVAAALAANALLSGEVRHIIVTRPAVEAGESLGFLPGEMEEKFEPYLRPVLEVLYERLPKRFVDKLVRDGQIEARPLAYLRGCTFHEAFVILDEAQNTTVKQMKMFLTRIGEGCTVVIDGDLDQSDIGSFSGLADATQRLQGVDGIEFVRFEVEDIVRSGIVQDIVRRYERPSD